MSTGASRAPHIILVGLPGAGKTRCGSMLARRLRRPFVDLDAEIERREQRAVREIFATGGEREFRRLESEVTRSLIAAPASVISPGGGWIEDEENRALVRGVSWTVYLRVSAETAFRRMGPRRDRRPLLSGAEPLGSLRAILERRESLYGLADVELDTEVLSPKEVVNELIRLALRRWGPVG
ncbi:MAG: Shikimate kinase [Gemmatimonadaceae bacterium]|nr:Shikimate kinase [Gemmatimonadaceae bacterium]